MSPVLKRLSLLAQTLPLAFTDEGEGRPFLLLHGGAGPASMAGLGAALGQGSRVVLPTHPGFGGEPRPEGFARIGDLVLGYLALIERLDLHDVVLVGNSVGGWIGAELALRGSPRVAGLVLLNAVGIDPDPAGRPIADPMRMEPAARSALSFHDPARFAFAPSGHEAAAAMAANQQTLRVYAGEPFMHDPGLRSRLAGMPVPALVAWGASDGIVDLDYGRRFAAVLPRARFEAIAEAGHFPQIERRDEVARLIEGFAAGL